jgi:5-methylcytosine-specific restriction endonuclease McrA
MMSVGIAHQQVQKVQRSRRRRKAPERALDDAPFASIQALDMELATVARSGGALRLALGTGLEALARTDGHHALGFSSMAGYALERCERSGRSVQEARSLSRRLSVLPRTREALISGSINWSMAAVLATIATTDDEEQWLRDAASSTVKSMRQRVRSLLHPAAAAGPDDSADPSPGPDEMCTLTLTVDFEDACLLECVRMVVRHIGGGTSANDVLEALVGEGSTSLVEHLPQYTPVVEYPLADDEKQRSYDAQRAKWRDEAETLCEPRIPRGPVAPGRIAAPLPPSPSYDFSGSPGSIDQELGRISAALAERDVVIGKLAEVFFRADGWRRLGYATPRQYAEERLGLSYTSLKEKRTLARRLRRLPHLAATLQSRRIGYEATRLVTLVATPQTDEPWAERAAVRTLRHLREEVNIALVYSRLGIEDSVLPPSEDDVREFQQARARIVTGGGLVGGAPRAPESRKSADDAVERASAISVELFERRQRTPHRLRSRGRIAMRLRVSRENRAVWRALERTYARYRPVPMTFSRYLCYAVLETWAQAMPPVAYGHVYERDGFACTNPVCTCCGLATLTPHHLRFRSHGGSDDDDNITSLCPWCHLDGVHGSRISVVGPANEPTWRIGRVPHTIVQGRTRTRLAAT